MRFKRKLQQNVRFRKDILLGNYTLEKYLLFTR